MKTKNANNGYGLLASGSTRCWDVSIDESLTHDGEWIAEIEGPRAYLTFQLTDINVVSEVVRYLDQSPKERAAESNERTNARMRR